MSRDGGQESRWQFRVFPRLTNKKAPDPFLALEQKVPGAFFKIVCFVSVIFLMEPLS